MEIRWHGHAFFSIRTRDGKQVLIDPFLDNGATTRRVDDFSPDLILITHAHQDHVGSALDFEAPILSVHEIANVLAKRGAADAVGMGVGGFYERDGIRYWCAPAVHSSGFDDEENGLPIYGGNPCGFVVDDGQTRFYHAGDTALFSDMKHVIRDLLQPHAAAVPIGDHYTMGPEHAARAVEWLGVNVAVPMHYDTFEPIRNDPKLFEKHVGNAAQVVIPKPDGGLEMEGRKLVRALEP